MITRARPGALCPVSGISAVRCDRDHGESCTLLQAERRVVRLGVGQTNGFRRFLPLAQRDLALQACSDGAIRAFQRPRNLGNVSSIVSR
jgi:hypothetical protein